MYYYNLRVYFAIYYVLQRTFLAIIFQILLIVYFPLVTLVTYERKRGKLGGEWGGVLLISGEKHEKHDGFRTFNIYTLPTYFCFAIDQK